MATSIDVVFYDFINKKTIHVDKFYSEESEGFISRKTTKERISGLHYKYYDNYQDAWQEILTRLKRLAELEPGNKEIRAKLDHWYLQREWDQNKMHQPWMNYTGSTGT